MPTLLLIGLTCCKKGKPNVKNFLDKLVKSVKTLRKGLQSARKVFLVGFLGLLKATVVNIHALCAILNENIF